MFFSFSLCTISLLVILVTYFRRATQKDLQRTSSPEDSEVCCYQCWKIMLVLVNFQNNVYNITSLYVQYFIQGSYLECYKLKSLGLDKRKNLVQGLYKRTQQRTLYKICLLYIPKCLVCAKSSQPTLNYYVCTLGPIYIVYIVGHYSFMLFFLCSRVLTLTLSSKNRKRENKLK